MKFRIVNLINEEHCSAVLSLLNKYMEDEMGIQKSLPADLAPQIIKGLRNHPAYLGFLVQFNNVYVGLANCNINFSTWKAKPLINIHDFVVHPDYRKQGVGKYLMKEMEDYAISNGYFKLNLEVREDNINAQGLYIKAGFKAGHPQMLFWEKVL